MITEEGAILGERAGKGNSECRRKLGVWRPPAWGGRPVNPPGSSSAHAVAPRGVAGFNSIIVHYDDEKHEIMFMMPLRTENADKKLVKIK